MTKTVAVIKKIAQDYPMTQLCASDEEEETGQKWGCTNGKVEKVLRAKKNGLKKKKEQSEASQKATASKTAESNKAKRKRALDCGEESQGDTTEGEYEGSSDSEEDEWLAREEADEEHEAPKRRTSSGVTKSRRRKKEEKPTGPPQVVEVIRTVSKKSSSVKWSDLEPPLMRLSRPNQVQVEESQQQEATQAPREKTFASQVSWIPRRSEKVFATEQVLSEELRSPEGAQKPQEPHASVAEQTRRDSRQASERAVKRGRNTTDEQGVCPWGTEQESKKQETDWADQERNREEEGMDKERRLQEEFREEGKLDAQALKKQSGHEKWLKRAKQMKEANQSEIDSEEKSILNKENRAGERKLATETRKKEQQLGAEKKEETGMQITRCMEKTMLEQKQIPTQTEQREDSLKVKNGNTAEEHVTVDHGLSQQAAGAVRPQNVEACEEHLDMKSAEKVPSKSIATPSHIAQCILVNITPSEDGTTMQEASTVDRVVRPQRIVLEDTGEDVTVGRAAGQADYVMDSPARLTSRTHARICRNMISGMWSIEDINSANGVWANGRRVKRKPLREGDHISFGPPCICSKCKIPKLTLPSTAEDKQYVSLEVDVCPPFVYRVDIQ